MNKSITVSSDGVNWSLRSCVNWCNDLSMSVMCDKCKASERMPALSLDKIELAKRSNDC